MIGGEIGRPEWNSTGPGTPMPIPHSPPGELVRLGEAFLEELVDASRTDVGAGGDVGGLARVHDDLAGEVGHGDVDARRAEVGDEQVTGVGAEAQLRGARPPVDGPTPSSAIRP